MAVIKKDEIPKHLKLLTVLVVLYHILMYVSMFPATHEVPYRLHSQLRTTEVKISANIFQLLSGLMAIACFRYSWRAALMYASLVAVSFIANIFRFSEVPEVSIVIWSFVVIGLHLTLVLSIKRSIKRVEAQE
jgi:uncharacterized membrane protein YdjX (TVP38/TMEM64 family)